MSTDDYRDDYENTGVRLAGSKETAYGGEQVVDVQLYRCKTCGATVMTHDWEDDRQLHSEWHARSVSVSVRNG